MLENDPNAKRVYDVRTDTFVVPADNVNHPPHYKVGGIETIDYLQAKLTPEEFAGFCKGNALKYISRANHKADAAEDLRKAAWYLDRLQKSGVEG